MPSKKTKNTDTMIKPLTIPVRHPLQHASTPMTSEPVPVESQAPPKTGMRVIEPLTDFKTGKTGVTKLGPKKVVPVIAEADEETSEPEAPAPQPKAVEESKHATHVQKKAGPQTASATPADDADERAELIQQYIESGRYYVPINAVAFKRSIKVSWLLTFVILLLAVVLIDLMLDSGLIILTQKIPHTHFFNLSV